MRDEAMTFAIKAAVSDPGAKTFTFNAQKTMYGGKRIAKGDTIYILASSTSSCIVRQRTGSSGFPMKLPSSSVDSPDPHDPDAAGDRSG